VAGILIAIGLIAMMAAGTASAVIIKRHGHWASLALRPGVSPQSLLSPAQRRRAAKHVGYDSGGNVFYNGGPVVHGVTNYAFYWDPAGEISAASRSLIDQYFTDVAHDSGTNGNNYSVLQQYGDGTGDIQYQQTFGGEVVDTNAYPANGCNHNGSGSATPGYTTTFPTSNCLTDGQLTSELSSYVAAHGLPTGLNTEYFIFTPPRVITCFSATSTPTSGSCSDNAYCAYHSAVGTTANPLLYADDPFTFEYDPVGHGNVMKGCQADGTTGAANVQEPNGNVADVVLKAVGHESRETLSDPLGDGWLDGQSPANELDDKCNAFGSTLGHDPNAFLPVSGATPTKFTQTYNGHNYYMQSEWSNGANGGAGACAMAPGPGTVSAAYTAPGPGAVGSTLSFASSSTSTNPLATATWDFGDGTGDIGASVAHAYATPGTYHVTLRLSDTLGNAGSVTHDVAVFAPSITLRKAKLNKSNGTAKLPVTVPGAGTLTLSGKGLVPIHKAKATKTVSAGTTKLKIKAKGKAAKTLKKTGKVKVKPKVTYKATGAAAVSKKTTIKLVRK
jgi:hypothetical protein